MIGARVAFATLTLILLKLLVLYAHTGYMSG